MTIEPAARAIAAMPHGCRPLPGLIICVDEFLGFRFAPPQALRWHALRAFRPDMIIPVLRSSRSLPPPDPRPDGPGYFISALRASPDGN